MLSAGQVHSLLGDLKADLKTALGDKLEELVLFGSYSRGDYSKYSDIDLIILVEDELTRSENATVDELVARYSLRYDIVISGLVYPITSYRKINTPFFLNVREEGIKI
ncbi:Nucleotidyltransferase domain protein [uncultured archaeon]|nr:Nucleotidyltransferase domain protein [uncultured archaeon]